MQVSQTMRHTLHPNSLREGSCVRLIAGVLMFVAATLGVASTLHLTGNVNGSPPFDADHAGIAEALIGAVLLVGGTLMLAAPRRARTTGLAATGFGIVGFVIGLSFTTRGGHAPDVAYHAIFLPVLIASLVALLRTHQPTASPTAR